MFVQDKNVYFVFKSQQNTLTKIYILAAAYKLDNPYVRVHRSSKDINCAEHEWMFPFPLSSWLRPIFEPVKREFKII